MESEPLRFTVLYWFESHGTIRIVSPFERVTARGTEATAVPGKPSLVGEVGQGKCDRAVTLGRGLVLSNRDKRCQQPLLVDTKSLTDNVGSAQSKATKRFS